MIDIMTLEGGGMCVGPQIPQFDGRKIHVTESENKHGLIG